MEQTFIKNSNYPTAINSGPPPSLLRRGAWIPFFALTFVFTLVLLASCNNEVEVPREKTPNRVVLVYMGGDNNLSGETYDKMDVISKGWKGAYDGRLFIYSDPADAVPTLYEVREVNHIGKADVVETYPEENSADSRVFERVIRKVTKENPADSYGLVVFSHASGWLPERTLIRPRSVVTDGTDEMEIADMAAAIPDGLFDFIVFEACFMAGIEVAYELKDKAEYIVASSAEIVSPGFTPVYHQVIEQLFRKEADLKGMIQTYYDYCMTQTEFLRSVTFSLIRTAGLPALGEWLGGKFREEGVLPLPEYTEAEVRRYQHFDRYSSYRLFFDFEDYYGSFLSKEVDREELSTLIKACVPYKVATPKFMEGANGFTIEKHSGMTTYIQQERFSFLNQEYRKLKWAAAL